MSELKNLDLNLLKALHILLQEKNVSRAAERLHLTQPAVSSMLNRLRHHFDEPLFVRSSRGIVPTDRALSLAEPLKQIMSQIQMLVQPAEFDPKTFNDSHQNWGNRQWHSQYWYPFFFAITITSPKYQNRFFCHTGTR